MTRRDCLSCPGRLLAKVTSLRYRTLSRSSRGPAARCSWSVPTPGGTPVARCAADRWRWSRRCSARDGFGSARTRAVTGSPRPACSCPMARLSPAYPASQRLPRSMPRHAMRYPPSSWAKNATVGAATSHLPQWLLNPLCDNRSRSPACLHSQPEQCSIQTGRTRGSAGSVISMVVTGTSSWCVRLVVRIVLSPAARRLCQRGAGRSSAVCECGSKVRRLWVIPATRRAHACPRRHAGRCRSPWWRAGFDLIMPMCGRPLLPTAARYGVTVRASISEAQVIRSIVVSCKRGDLIPCSSRRRRGPLLYRSTRQWSLESSSIWHFLMLAH